MNNFKVGILKIILLAIFKVLR